MFHTILNWRMQSPFLLYSVAKELNKFMLPPPPSSFLKRKKPKREKKLCNYLTMMDQRISIIVVLGYSRCFLLIKVKARPAGSTHLVRYFNTTATLSFSYITRKEEKFLRQHGHRGGHLLVLPGGWLKRFSNFGVYLCKNKNMNPLDEKLNFLSKFQECNYWGNNFMISLP